MGKKKRGLAVILAVMLILSFVPQKAIYADTVEPVQDLKVTNVDVVAGVNSITGETELRPRISLQWTEPDMASDSEYSLQKYVLELNNTTKGTKDLINIDKTQTSFDVHSEYDLDTGCFYQIRVIPQYIYSVTDVAGNTTFETTQPSQNPAVYVITDIHVDLETENNSIQVTWDDVNLQDIQYRLTYAMGDYSDKSKTELMNNAAGTTTLSKEDAISIYDPAEKRDKLQYTISNNIVPGQMYTVLVEPVIQYYQGNHVYQNVNAPHMFTCFTDVSLSVTEDGEYVRLEWDIPDEFQVKEGDSDTYSLSELKIVKYVDGQAENVAIFYGTNGSKMSYYKDAKPSKLTEYQLELKYTRGGSDVILAESNRVPYSPYTVNLRPTKPYIPQPVSEQVISELEDLSDPQEELQEKYLVPGDSFSGNLGQLLTADYTVHIDKASEGINLAWSAFRRKDYQQSSETYNQTITDFNVYYDISVTNDLNAVGSTEKVIEDLKINTADEDMQIKDEEDETVGFHTVLNEYSDPDEDELQTIIPGQLYYIQIAAKKVIGDTTLQSEPETIAIYYTYDGDAYAPPTMTKPPLKLSDGEPQETSAQIEWRENWYEIISQDTTTGSAIKKWQYEVYPEDSDGDGVYDILYPSQQNDTTKFDLVDLEAVQYLRENMPEGYFDANYIYRSIDLGKDPYGNSDVNYQLYVQPYEEVQNIIEREQRSNPEYDLEKYITDLMQNEENGITTIEWEEIDPVSDPNNPNILTYNKEQLTENTSYLFLLRPYRILLSGEKAATFYPASLIVTTPPEGQDIEPVPTVPYLVEDSHSDTWATIRWKYNLDFTYEVRYSTVENISQAKTVEWTLPEDPDDPDYPVNGENYLLTVDDLFPDTQYYFWIQATNPDTGQTSAWSNALLIITTDVEVPLPPRGIGVGSLESLNPKGIDYSIGEDYITIEWLLDVEDPYGETEEEPTDSSVSKEYSYILEVADNPQFMDVIRMEINDDAVGSTIGDAEILDKNLVKVNGLIANRPYYVRMKTKVIVINNSEGEQLEKESVYSEAIRIITSTTNEEYDGESDPTKEILPDENFERIYDDDDDELIFRFRKDSEDEDGNPDNDVDERLISEMIEKNIYTYVVDVNRYKNKKIQRRSILIPMNIVSAMMEEQISLEIQADDLRMTIPMEAFDNQTVKKSFSYGDNPELHLTIDTWTDSQQLNMPPNISTSMVEPKELKVKVYNDNMNESISYFEEAVTIEIEPSSRVDLYNKEASAYQYYPEYRGWTRKEGDLTEPEGFISFTTGAVGAYGIYATGQNLVSTNPGHWSEPYRQSVEKEFNIIGLPHTYNPNNWITQQQLTNMVLGLVNGYKDINLYGTIKTDQMRQMQMAGIMGGENPSGSSVRRDAAIDMFAKAYEALIGYPIDMEQSSSSMVTDYSSIVRDRRQGVLKGKMVGLITGNTIRPGDPVTFGEMFCMFDRVWQGAR